MMKYVGFVLGCFMFLTIKAQHNSLSRPEIGKTFTSFTLDSVDNYSKKLISYNDFKGKWIILDFWGEYCSGCIESFPKINAFQKKYQDKIQIVLVTQTSTNSNSAIALFKKLRKKFDLSIPVSYDQNFVTRVGPRGLPTIIIINPKGIVKAITNNIYEEDIVKLIHGEVPQLKRSYLVDEISPSDSYDTKAPLLIGNTEVDESKYLYRSIITKWDPSASRYNILVRRNRFEVLGADLKSLYRLAYFGLNFWGAQDTVYYGKYCYDPILDLKDLGVFDSDPNISKNKFCYSISFDKDIITDSVANSYVTGPKPRYQKLMQKDLESYFGYAVEIENRKQPYYKLIATQDARERLSTKGGDQYFEQPAGGKALIAKNIPIETLISKISLSAKFPFYTMPVVDETGIDSNIDITIDAVYFDDWLKELRKQGLDLVTGEKEMKVLVIRDAKPLNN